MGANAAALAARLERECELLEFDAAEIRVWGIEADFVGDPVEQMQCREKADGMRRLAAERLINVARLLREYAAESHGYVTDDEEEMALQLERTGIMAGQIGGR